MHEIGTKLINKYNWEPWHKSNAEPNLGPILLHIFRFFQSLIFRFHLLLSYHNPFTMWMANFAIIGSLSNSGILPSKTLNEFLFNRNIQKAHIQIHRGAVFAHVGRWESICSGPPG
jgi:hypothetical protein